jgi:hypothetical protein
MKTLLLTGFDNKMKELGELTSPVMLAYASRHEMDFRCVRTYPPGVPAYWQKMLDVIIGFDEGYNRVIWVDADILITNFDYVPEWSTGFHASMDWGRDATGPECFSMCCFVACPDSRHLFQWVIDHREDYINGDFPEQKPMRELYDMSEANRQVMTIHPSRVFNSVPIEVHETVVNPWQPGDWLCHLTMIPFSDRVKLFHEIRSRNEVA